MPQPIAIRLTDPAHVAAFFAAMARGERARQPEPAFDLVAFLWGDLPRKEHLPMAQYKRCPQTCGMCGSPVPSGICGYCAFHLAVLFGPHSTIPCPSCFRWPKGQCLSCDSTGSVPVSHVLSADQLAAIAA